MKHIDFSRPVRLINPHIRKGSIYNKPPHERILFTRKVKWPKDPKNLNGLPTKRSLQK